MRSHPLAGFAHWFRDDIEQPAAHLLGGPERFKVIVLLACTLGLDAADKATIGATAVKLEQALDIGNVQVGLLVTVTAGVGAIATLPLGVLVDRMHRVRLLTTAIVLWSLATAISGFSTSYVMLLLTRLALGAVVATAAPVVASLTGDFFHPIERGRIYGYILTGELLGAAFGFLLSGIIADLLSWRAPFWVLAAIGAALAALLHGTLSEPARGGQSRLGADSTSIYSSARTGHTSNPPTARTTQSAEEDPVEKHIEALGVQPERSRILGDDPIHLPWLRAVGYILTLRTNVLIIIASALGYFYLSGLKTFGVVYMHAHFNLSQSAASAILVASGVGAIVGVLIVGRIADRLIKAGFFRARLWMAAIAFVLAVIFLVPGFLSDSLYATAALFFIGALGLGGVNPPMSAARLDIMHSRLWGRAESVRSALRYAFVAIAPLVFGYVSTLLGGAGHGFQAAAGQLHGNGTGLGLTLAIMLTTLIGASAALLVALKTYPTDVATAHVFETRTLEKTATGRDRN